MTKPIVAIVGRPNVGKSTFFNRLIGERRAIVEDIPGTTRDRLYGDTFWNGREFTVVDTAGILFGVKTQRYLKPRSVAVLVLRLNTRLPRPTLLSLWLTDVMA